jgi:hypothetical protein
VLDASSRENSRRLDALPLADLDGRWLRIQRTRVRASIRSTLRRVVVVFSFVDFVYPQAAKADDPATQPAQTESQAYLQSGYGNANQGVSEAGQNPLSGLDSLLVSFTFDGGVGSFDRTAVGVHQVPTVPIGLTKSLALVAIVDLNVKGIPDFNDETTTHWGFGDSQPQFFFAINIGEVFVGPGLDLVIPTASESFVGAGKWQLGPGLIFSWVH